MINVVRLVTDLFTHYSGESDWQFETNLLDVINMVDYDQLLNYINSMDEKLQLAIKAVYDIDNPISIYNPNFARIIGYKSLKPAQLKFYGAIRKLRCNRKIWCDSMYPKNVVEAIKALSKL